MRPAFTLIELLVVIAMLTILMLLVGPSGKKVLESTERYLERKEQERELGSLRYRAFIEARSIDGDEAPLLKEQGIARITPEGVAVAEE
jgi:prepilin-type N-terminal cleavage/methylation domain-containing protein